MRAAIDFSEIPSGRRIHLTYNAKIPLDARCRLFIAFTLRMFTAGRTTAAIVAAAAVLAAN
jgi:hypothetical protein